MRGTLSQRIRCNAPDPCQFCSCAPEGYWSHLYAFSHDRSSREDDEPNWQPVEPERSANSVVPSMWHALPIFLALDYRSWTGLGYTAHGYKGEEGPSLSPGP